MKVPEKNNEEESVIKKFLVCSFIVLKYIYQKMKYW